YTISKAAPRTKDLGHFILDLNSCGERGPSLANVVAATVNGMDWKAHLEASEGRGTGCAVGSPNFVTFDELPSADTYVLELTLDDVYAAMDSSGWLKAGRSCQKRPMLGPGCRGYVRTTAMEADVALAGKAFGDINTFMRTVGFDYTEHPNCS